MVLSDRVLFREWLVFLLSKQGFRSVSGAGDLRLSRARPLPDLVFLDLGQRKRDPRDQLAALRGQSPATTVVAIGTPLQLAAQAVEPDGYVDVDRPSVGRIAAVASAVGRRARLGLRVSPEVERLRRRWQCLTPRERQVLAFLSCGDDNLQMAAWLGISERGIKAHVSSLFTKLGVTNRTALALLAHQAGLRCPAEDGSGAALSFRTLDGVDPTR